MPRMTPIHWWAGITVISLALMADVAFPRYEWRDGPTDTTLVRVDRWTRRTQVFSRPRDWMPPPEFKRDLPLPYRPFRRDPVHMDPPIRPERLAPNAIQVPLKDAT